MKSKKPLKILIVLYYYEPYVSGVTIYAKKLAESLVKKGHNVTVLTSRHDKSLPKEEIINEVRVVRRPILFRLDKGVIMPSFWIDVVRRSKHYDIINPHLPMPDTGLSSLFIKKNKQLTTYQCDISLRSGILGKIIVALSFLLMRLQLSRSKNIVVLSNDYFNNSKFSHYSFKAHQIYPPIFTNDFKYVNSDSLLKKLGLKNEEIKIGFMGRIVYEKGIDYLLGSIKHLDKKLTSYKIIIAGDYSNIAGGSIKNKLDNLVSKYPDKIIFTGYLPEDDKNKFYSMIDVLVLPSIDPLEAFGMVQVEAMLCGAPVVASDMPGVREVINRTGYGLLCEPKNSFDIAEKILVVLNNKNDYLPDKKRVKSIFNLNETLDAYIELMQ